MTIENNNNFVRNLDNKCKLLNNTKIVQTNSSKSFSPEISRDEKNNRGGHDKEQKKSKFIFVRAENYNILVRHGGMGGLSYHN